MQCYPRDGEIASHLGAYGVAVVVVPRNRCFRRKTIKQYSNVTEYLLSRLSRWQMCRTQMCRVFMLTFFGKGIYLCCQHRVGSLKLLYSVVIFSRTCCFSALSVLMSSPNGV